MSRRASPVSLFLLAWLSVVSVFGQQPANDFEARSPSDVKALYELLFRSDVGSELQITRTQRLAMHRSKSAADDLQAERDQKESSLSPREIEQLRHRIYAAKVAAAVNCLDPPQVERLEQLLVQHQLLFGDWAALLGRTVGLSEEQQKQVREKEAELGQELRQFMWTGYRRSQRELAKLMTPEQRTSWRKAVGEDFEFQTSFTGLSHFHALTYRAPMRAKDRPAYELALLANRSCVQEELELIDDQVAAINRANSQEAQQRMRRRMREYSERVKQTSILEEKRAILAELNAYVAQMAEDRAEVRSEVLLPHQLRRLDELRWRQRSIVEPVRTFDDVVGLTNAQRTKMTAKAQELCHDLTGQMWGLQRSYRNEISMLLTPEQRIELNKKTGEDFIFETTTEIFQILIRLR